MFKKNYALAIAFSLTFSLSSCSISQFTDLFSDYGKQMQQVRVAQSNGDFIGAQTLLVPRRSSDNAYTLGLLEQGRLQFLAQQHTASKNTFILANQEVEHARQQAKIQISKGIENVGALISNDNTITYQVPLYEQTMLYSYQALNYLYQQDLEAALIEVRRANLVQSQALSENQQAVFKANQKMAQQGIKSTTLNNPSLSMNNVIGDVKNGFQNAYTFYLSALLYEAAGEANSAYIDYKKALEIFENNKYLQQDVLRLANKLGMQDDLQHFNQRFTQTKSSLQQKSQPLKKNAGQLVIITEQGIITPKQTFDLNIPIFNHHNDVRFYSVSLPVYKNYPTKSAYVNLTIEGNYYQSETIVRLQSLAAKQLKDQMPAIITRQVARLFAKEELRQQMARKGGDIGNIFATIYNVASENADTRSWNTLPASIEILKTNLSAGSHELEIYIAGVKHLIKVNITPERTTLINITHINNFIDYQILNL